MRRGGDRGRVWGVAGALAVLAASGCRSPEAHRADADRTGLGLVDRHRAGLVSNAVPFTIERPSDTFRRRLLEVQGLPTTFAVAITNRAAPAVAAPGKDVAPMSLADALRVAFANSREYQDARELVFTAALDLDLQGDAFRSTFAGLVSGSYSDTPSGETRQRGAVGSFEPGLTQRFRSGAEASASLALDVAGLLTGDEDSAFGILADLSLTVPLLRGAGRDIVMEPLTQAERNLVYEIQRFERHKRTFAVEIVEAYLGVLQLSRRVENQEENLRGIALVTRRAEELGKAGRTSEVQVNLARQRELSARDQLASARQGVTAALDRFKVQMGLPIDARIHLDPRELDSLPTPVDDVPMAEEDAMRMALALRLDFRIAKGRVEDARRGVRVSADALRAGLSLTVSGTSGGRRTVSSAAQEDAEIRIDQGTLRAAVGLQLPWERTAERNAYRKSLLALDAAERAAEAAEDQVKGDVRSTYRTLSQSREVCGIQEQALALADRRVKSTELLLEAGRAEMRDLVEARDSLLQAQNSVIAARINYRMAELGLWRTVESLRVTEDGVMGDVHVAGP